MQQARLTYKQLVSPAHGPVLAMLCPAPGSSSVGAGSAPPRKSVAPEMFQDGSAEEFIKWRVPAEPGGFLAKALALRWRNYRKEIKNCRKHFSEESVHETRVAIRRLMAHLRLIGELTAGEDPRQACTTLKRQLKSLGDLRDSHVQLGYVNKRLSRYPELVLVRKALLRQERRKSARLARTVRELKTRKVEQCVRALERTLADEISGTEVAENLLGSAREIAQRAFDKAVRRLQAVDTEKPETIHRTRTAFKQFRYVVESLSPAFTGTTARQLRSLARHQRAMGRIQDLQVVCECIERYAERHSGAEPLLNRPLAHVRRELRNAINSFSRKAGRLFDYAPEGHPGARPPFSHVL